MRISGKWRATGYLVASVTSLMFIGAVSAPSKGGSKAVEEFPLLARPKLKQPLSLQQVLNLPDSYHKQCDRQLFAEKVPVRRPSLTSRISPYQGRVPVTRIWYGS